MDFIDNLRILAARIENSRSIIQTEEATKNSMIMPMIQLLGYNVFDPFEVTPEFVADIGTKKGEKVDYAIMRDGKPIILFECKKAGEDLNIKHAGQLFRYFHVTSSRFGILTNGLRYQFFTDLEEPNKMDEKPFFEFNILDFKERDVEELKKFAKSSFDVDSILNTATDLKYMRLIKNKLAGWVASPGEDFVRLVVVDMLDNKRFTNNVKEQFTELTKRAFEQLVGELINDRLKGAMTPVISSRQSTHAQVPEDNQKNEDEKSREIATSQLEIEAFYIIKTILHRHVSSKRVFMRDAASYCAILLDDNNRKTICRLRFNNESKLGISIFNEKKEEERIPLSQIDDIYGLADRLIESAKRFLVESGDN